MSRVVHSPQIGRRVVRSERRRDQSLGGRIDRRHGEADALATERRGRGGALDGHRDLDHDLGVDRRQGASVLDIEGSRAPPGLNVDFAGAEFERFAGEARQRRHRAWNVGRLQQRRVGRDPIKAAQRQPLRPGRAIGGVEQESQARSLRGENTRCHWETLCGAKTRRMSLPTPNFMFWPVCKCTRRGGLGGRSGRLPAGSFLPRGRRADPESRAIS